MINNKIPDDGVIFLWHFSKVSINDLFSLFFSQFELTHGIPRHFLDPLEIYVLFLLLDTRMGGVWSVLGPLVEQAEVT